MSIYTHGGESDPRRDGCDSCQDLRNEVKWQSTIIADLRVKAERSYRLRDALSARTDEVEALSDEIDGWRRSFNDLSARHLQALSDIETLRTAADRLTAAEALRNIVLTEEQMALIPGHPEAASAPSPGPDSP